MAKDNDRPEDETDEDQTEAAEPDEAGDDGADGTERDDEPDQGDDEPGDGESTEPGESEDDDEEEVLEARDPEEVRGLKGRARTRVLAALERAKTAERERDEARAASDTKRAADAQAAANAEAARHEEIIKSLPSDAERVQYRMALEIKKTQAMVQQNAAAQHDANDRIAFTTKYAAHPRYARLLPDVEKRYEGLRSTGAFIPREAVLAYVIGERMLKDGDKAGSRQRKAGARRIQQERGRSGNVRSDTRGERRGGSLVDRMERDDAAI